MKMKVALICSASSFIWNPFRPFRNKLQFGCVAIVFAFILFTVWIGANFTAYKRILLFVAIAKSPKLKKNLRSVFILNPLTSAHTDTHKIEKKYYAP